MVKKSKAVLVVDDEECILKMIKRILESEGFLVETACNLKQAWDIVSSDKSIFVVLSDVDLKKGGLGFDLNDLCNSLGIELILMSGDPSYENQAMAMGRFFFEKMSGVGKIIETIKMLR